MTPQRIKFIVENLTQRCDEDSRDALEVIAELQAELAIYKGRDEAKQLVIDRLEREIASRQSWKESPVAYEYRQQDSEWVRIVPRNQYTSTVEDGVKEIQQYIAAGYKYELRALYVGPLPPLAEKQCKCSRCIKEQDPPHIADLKLSMGMSEMIVCSVCGNKRCPKADDHRNVCSGSNELNQVPAQTGGKQL